MSQDRPEKSDWSVHIEAWQESGLSQNAYCQQQQLRPSQFSYWKRKLLDQSVETAGTPNLIPVRLAPASTSTLTVTLPNGIKLAGDSPASLAVLAESLRGL